MADDKISQKQAMRIRNIPALGIDGSFPGRVWTHMLRCKLVVGRVGTSGVSDLCNGLLIATAAARWCLPACGPWRGDGCRGHAD